LHFRIRGYHPLWPAFPDRSPNALLPSFNLVASQTFLLAKLRDYCGPATPNSPCESFGLASSAFARRYLRNHGCFLFLEVLRWFTSLGSLPPPMYSATGIECTHSMGSPIRIFPDHRLLAPPRDFSQLATSFFASPRQGIHTHALSSLTIKSTPHTEQYSEPGPSSTLAFRLHPSPLRHY
jgi:hypothetical protein